MDLEIVEVTNKVYYNRLLTPLYRPKKSYKLVLKKS